MEAILSSPLPLQRGLLTPEHEHSPSLGKELVLDSVQQSLQQGIQARQSYAQHGDETYGSADLQLLTGSCPPARPTTGSECLHRVHHTLWWIRHAGMLLAGLLEHADYTLDSQDRHLAFFAHLVAPYLGPSRRRALSAEAPWPSFMTDDGMPLELSWDWGTGDGPPTIRYSIEPIGLNAGTPLDPVNLAAGPAFHKHMLQHLPAARLEWFNHFHGFFNRCDAGDGTSFVQDFKDHSTSIFYAFDLPRGVDDEITAKAYYFPKMRARRRGQTHLEVLTEAVCTAPGVDPTNMKSLATFRDFCHDARNGSLEHEMLAIDLEDPSEGRIKIYFRSRETSFSSVASTFSLGGRVCTPTMARGIESLRQLWHDVLDVEDDESLSQMSDHRTAGILYNVELWQHGADPVVKVYIPVRHYASSDEAVMRGLAKYFARSSSAGRFRDAMRTLYTAEMLSGRGVQTYLACSIRPNGRLRVVSYMKPCIV